MGCGRCECENLGTGEVIIFTIMIKKLVKAAVVWYNFDIILRKRVGTGQHRARCVKVW